MGALAVSAAAELAEVGEPAVRPLDWPAQPEGDGQLRRLHSGALELATLTGADDVADAVLSAVFTNGRTVVAAVEMERLDVEEKAARLGGVEGRGEQNGVVAVRTAGRPTDRDAPSVGDERPLPAELSPVSGVSSALCPLVNPLGSSQLPAL